MAVDDHVDLVEVIEHSDGEPTGTTRRMQRTPIGADVSCVQQTESSLTRVLLGHVTRVM